MTAISISVLHQQKQLPDAELISVHVNENEDERDLRVVASGHLGHVSILNRQLVKSSLPPLV